MAYRFLLNEDFETGARRIALEQVARARRSLAGEDSGAGQVHQARKAIKRLRALLQIIRPGLGEKSFAKENGALKAIAKLLSEPRSLDAVHETIAKLEAHFGIRPEGLTARLRSRLAKRQRRAEKNLRAPAIDKLRNSLTKAETRLAALRLRRAGPGMVCKGLAISYAVGRRRLKKAYATGGDDVFHDLRKAVQLHWRHMQLMSDAWPEALTPRIAAARELSQILGDDHDLSELVAFMRKERRGLAAGESIAMSGLCAARQYQLRSFADPRAKRLFAGPAPEIRHLMRQYWRAARQMSYMEHPRRSGLIGDTKVIALKA